MPRLNLLTVWYVTAKSVTATPMWKGWRMDWVKVQREYGEPGVLRRWLRLQRCRLVRALACLFLAGGVLGGAVGVCEYSHLGGVAVFRVFGAYAFEGDPVGVFFGGGGSPVLEFLSCPFEAVVTVAELPVHGGEEDVVLPVGGGDYQGFGLGGPQYSVLEGGEFGRVDVFYDLHGDGRVRSLEPGIPVGQGAVQEVQSFLLLRGHIADLQFLAGPGEGLQGDLYAGDLGEDGVRENLGDEVPSAAAQVEDGGGVGGVELIDDGLDAEVLQPFRPLEVGLGQGLWGLEFGC